MRLNHGELPVCFSAPALTQLLILCTNKDTDIYFFWQLFSAVVSAARRRESQSPAELGLWHFGTGRLLPLFEKVTDKVNDIDQIYLPAAIEVPCLPG